MRFIDLTRIILLFQRGYPSWT